MRILLKPEVLVIVADDETDRATIAELSESARGRVFAFSGDSDRGFSLHDLGPHDEACRKPIDVVSSNRAYAAIGNLARAPFVLDGARYASVEGFRQSLETNDPSERARIATLEHRGPRDSRTILGIVMADIWMRIRTHLRVT